MIVKLRHITRQAGTRALAIVAFLVAISAAGDSLASPSGVLVDQLDCGYDTVANVFRPVITIFRFANAELDPQNKARVNLRLFQGGTQIGFRATGLQVSDDTVMPNGTYTVPLGESRRFTTQPTTPLVDTSTGAPLQRGSFYEIEVQAFDAAQDVVFLRQSCRAEAVDRWGMVIEGAYRAYVDHADPSHGCEESPVGPCVDEDVACQQGVRQYLTDSAITDCYRQHVALIGTPPTDPDPSLGYYRQILNITCAAARSEGDARCAHFAHRYSDFAWGEDWIYDVMYGYTVGRNSIADPDLPFVVAGNAGEAFAEVNQVCDTLSDPFGIVPDWLVPIPGAVGAPLGLCAPITQMFQDGDGGALGAGAPHFGKQLAPQFKERSDDALGRLDPGERRSRAAAELCAIVQQHETFFENGVKRGFDDVRDAGLMSDAAAGLAKAVVPAGAALLRNQGFSEILDARFGAEDGGAAMDEFTALCGGGIVQDAVDTVTEVLDATDRVFRLTFPLRFFPFAWVDAIFHSESVYLTSVQADAAGTVVVEFEVPSAIAAGEHQLEVRGLGPEGGLIALGTAVTVGEPPVTTTTAESTSTTTTTTTTSTTSSTEVSTTTTTPTSTSSTEVTIATTSTTFVSTTTSFTTTTTVPVAGEGLAGKKLVLRTNVDPAKRSATIQSSDPTITLGRGDGTPDDPTLAGASLRVGAASGEFEFVLAMPASAWKRVSAKAPGKGYKYSDSKAALGPVKAALLKPGPKGASLKIILKGPFELGLSTDPRPVNVRLTLGDHVMCMAFGGTVTFKPGVSYVAANAPPTACE